MPDERQAAIDANGATPARHEVVGAGRRQPAGSKSDVLAGGIGYSGPSFRLRNRLLRMAWNLVQCLAFHTSPRFLHGWRTGLLRMFGAKIGKGSHVYPGARIWAPWNLELGDFVGIGDGATLYNMGRLCIGSHATVSQGAHLCGGSHDADSGNFQLVTGPIDIEPFAWICAEAFIGPGVRIPEGAVVGARSVVMRSLTQPWTVYAGVPCQAIRPRSQAVRRAISPCDPAP